MTRFSAVVPTHDRRRLAERAIESIKVQQHQVAEIVVVDDGSTDDTAAVLGERTDIRLLTQPNRGAAAARNTGWRAATSEWIAFLDSDDVWRPDHLELMAQAIEATAGVGDVYFADLLKEDGSNHWRWAGFEISGPHEMIDDATYLACAPRQAMMLQACVVRRRALDRVGGFAEWLWTREDTHLFLRLLAGRPAVAVGHIGTEMTADADATTRIGHDSGRSDTERALRYWECTAALYQDLVERRIMLGPAEATLRHRLAGSHLRIAGRLATRSPGRAVGHVVSAVRSDPAGMARRLKGKVTGG